MINDRLYLIKQQTEIENLQNENENLLKDLKELSLENSTLKEKLEENIGKEIEVLVENISFDRKYLIGRTRKDAPDIDGVVY